MPEFDFLGLAIELMSASASSNSAVYHGYPVEEADLQSKQTYIYLTSFECALECKERSDCSFFSYSKTSESCRLGKCFSPPWLTGTAVGEADDQTIVYIRPEHILAIRNDLAGGECWLTNSS